jgi:hypothetical protein
MHPLNSKNKYVGLMFMKMSQEYYSLGRDGIRKVSLDHVKALTPYSHLLTHVVSAGLSSRYDQVTIIEADTLEEIHSAGVAFRMGAKAAYIDVVDIVVGIKAPPRNAVTTP